jgi:hypothetical protein
MLRLLQSEGVDEEEEIIIIISILPLWMFIFNDFRSINFFRSPTLLPFVLGYSYRGSFTLLASL